VTATRGRGCGDPNSKSDSVTVFNKASFTPAPACAFERFAISS